MRRGLRCLLWVAAMASTSACAQDSEATGPPGIAPQLEVRNLTQWKVWDVRLHPAPSYSDAPNRLGSPPIAPRGAQRFGLSAADATSYVTVIRDKVQDGDRIAFTSAYPVDLRGYAYALEVLEGEFRLRQLEMLPPADGPQRPDAYRPDAPRFDAHVLRDGWHGGAGDAADAAARDGSPGDARRTGDAPDGGARPDAALPDASLPAG